MVDSKKAFLQALVAAIFIFIVGMALGFFMENSRTDQVQTTLMQSEISLLDQQLQNKEFTTLNLSCESSIQSTFDFADKVYNEANQLEKYDAASKFTSTLKTIHKRYDLLRTMLWLQSTEIKSHCPNQFHTVVYLFEYSSDDINTKAKQNAMSKALQDLKNQQGNRILLIPIAANLDLESINLVKKEYNINQLPAIIIDEKTVITELKTPQELQNILSQASSISQTTPISLKPSR